MRAKHVYVVTISFLLSQSLWAQSNDWPAITNGLRTALTHVYYQDNIDSLSKTRPIFPPPPGERVKSFQSCNKLTDEQVLSVIIPWAKESLNPNTTIPKTRIATSITSLSAYKTNTVVEVLNEIIKGGTIRLYQLNAVEALIYASNDQSIEKVTRDFLNDHYKLGFAGLERYVAVRCIINSVGGRSDEMRSKVFKSIKQHSTIEPDRSVFHLMDKFLVSNDVAYATSQTRLEALKRNEFNPKEKRKSWAESPNPVDRYIASELPKLEQRRRELDAKGTKD